jgi:L-alanine-DL-glutamate epimerase-like enolase superfamily enzyme
LWDIRGKVEVKPIYELLGGGQRDTIRAYASYLFGETPEGTAKLARDAVDLGLTAVKFGWEPFGKDPAVDIAHLEAAREVLGDGRDLMADAGHAWDWKTALERARLFERFNLGWLEEPLSQDDRKGYQQLCGSSRVPIAAGEGDVTVWDFEDLIERGLHVVQPDVAICGGLTVCKKVSAMAEAAGRRCVPHCFSTGINLTASLHWMSSSRNGDLVEYCLRPSPLMRKLVKNLPPLENGRVAVPQGPGLGIELDEEIVANYRVAVA